jgi:hypothetical protein
MRHLERRAEAFRREADARMRTFREEVAALSREIDALKKVCDSLRNDSIARDRGRARLDHNVKEVMSYLVRPMPAAPDNVVCISVGSVLGTLSGHYDLQTPLYKSGILLMVLAGRAERWSS